MLGFKLEGLRREDSAQTKMRPIYLDLQVMWSLSLFAVKV